VMIDDEDKKMMEIHIIRKCILFMHIHILFIYVEKALVMMLHALIETK